jgi:hypothetical protein
MWQCAREQAWQQHSGRRRELAGPTEARSSSGVAEQQARWSTWHRLAPNDRNFPAGGVPVIINNPSADSNFGNLASVPAARSGLPEADIEGMLTGIYASAVGCLVTYDGQAEGGGALAVAATTIDRPSYGYPGTVACAQTPGVMSAMQRDCSVCARALVQSNGSQNDLNRSPKIGGCCNARCPLYCRREQACIISSIPTTSSPSGIILLLACLLLIACSSPCVCVLMQCWGRGAAPQLEEADMSAAFCVFVVRCLGRVSLTSRSRCAACLSRAVPTSARRDRCVQ